MPAVKLGNEKSKIFAERDQKKKGGNYGGRGEGRKLYCHY